MPVSASRLTSDTERLARVALMRVAEPGDVVMGRLIAYYGAAGALEQIRQGRFEPEFAVKLAEPGECGADFTYPGTGRRIHLARLLDAWVARLPLIDPERDLVGGQWLGARLVVPGDLEWPRQLDDLGYGRPYALWLHGSADLRFSCLRSVSVVGSRAATAYGAHLSAELGASLSDSGWSVVSGGAYGIDGAAHRGALAGEAATIAVLACGTDMAYPRGHAELFAAIRANGLILSECPMGVRPTRLRFLVRNRVIAALTRGTVVVEAALRSGALSTVGHAVTLQRHVGAMPGPITSEMSAGCHQLIRQNKAVCVTSAEEVIELVGIMGDDLAPSRRGPVLPRDALNEETRRVLEAVPARIGAGPATIAVSAGVDLTTTLSCLGGLAAAGYVERVKRGWRLRLLPGPVDHTQAGE